MAPTPGGLLMSTLPVRLHGVLAKTNLDAYQELAVRPDRQPHPPK
jgi:hypothetical protein